MKNKLYTAFMSHAQGHIDKHVANVAVMLEKPVGIGEHSDIMETIQKELDAMAAAHDRLEMIDMYFKVDASIPGTSV